MTFLDTLLPLLFGAIAILNLAAYIHPPSKESEPFLHIAAPASSTDSSASSFSATSSPVFLASSVAGSVSSATSTVFTAAFIPDDDGTKGDQTGYEDHLLDAISADSLITLLDTAAPHFGSTLALLSPEAPAPTLLGKGGREGGKDGGCNRGGSEQEHEREELKSGIDITVYLEARLHVEGLVTLITPECD